jgi:hypothetical protein
MSGEASEKGSMMRMFEIHTLSSIMDDSRKVLSSLINQSLWVFVYYQIELLHLQRKE